MKEEKIVQEDQASYSNQEVNLDSGKGDNLMLKRVLLKELSKEEPKQRRTLFRVKCKIHGKFFKVIVYFGSTDNIILEKWFIKYNW